MAAEPPRPAVRKICSGAGLAMVDAAYRVEFVADRQTRRFFDPQTQPHRIVARDAFDEGLLVRALGFTETVSFSPPLSVTANDIEQAIDRFARALDRAMPELRQLAG